MLTAIVEVLAADLIPRLRAEEKVLLPLVSTSLEPGTSKGLSCAEVSRLTETISTLGARAAVSDSGRIQSIASTLLAVLEEKRLAEATLVARVRALPVADHGAGSLGDRLEEEAHAARASQFFVSEADRLPTEAWVLRDNPKSARIGRLAPGRTSPVADLVAVLESAV
ncbi:MAG TPA: hypothetical protein VLU92_08370 [Candidatus Dormibacteraeota bacterium]|nr:hypothetical protein [Candidatus Dormibacteraeota bacterium]